VKGRAWLIPVVLLAIIGGLVLLVPNKPSSCSDRRSDCDAPEGTSALLELASRMGHPSRAMSGTFAVPESRALLFVFSPDLESVYSESDASKLAAWVAGGGTLVYADDFSNREVDRRFGVSRGPRVRGPQGPDGERLPLELLASPPLVAVDRVEGDVSGATFHNNPDQVVLLRATGGQTVAFQQALGKGRLVVLGDPQVLANSSLGKLDNGHFAEDLVSLAAPGAPVVFDEVHHGAGAATQSLNDWALTPWGAAIAWTLLVLYLGLLLRGRAFGPQLPIHARGERSSAEYASAVGALLRRAGARGLTFNVLLDSTRRALAERTGLGQAGADRLLPALEKRAPDLARELGAAEEGGAAVVRSDAELLRAARKLHALAYPSAKVKR
jgi:hypothetical protein